MWTPPTEPAAKRQKRCPTILNQATEHIHVFVLGTWRHSPPAPRDSNRESLWSWQLIRFVEAMKGMSQTVRASLRGSLSALLAEEERVGEVLTTSQQREAPWERVVGGVHGNSDWAVVFLFFLLSQ